MTNSDGNNTEGIGAMTQYQIVCYVLSKLYDVGYYFNGFRNLNHYQYFNITKEKWCLDINNFFNFPIINQLENYENISFYEIQDDLENFINNNKDKNIIINFNIIKLLKFIDEFIDNESIQSYFKEINNRIILDEKFKYYNSNTKNIAIHIRKFTKTDCCLHPRRELFDKTKETFYINIIKNIEKLNKNKKQYHIFSQGDINQFNFLKQLEIDIQFHIEECPIISLYHMINSNILVTSNSSLSYISHILKDRDLTLVRNTFFHKWKNNTVLLDINGNFNI
jgi:hypothetical protein